MAQTLLSSQLSTRSSLSTQAITRAYWSKTAPTSSIPSQQRIASKDPRVGYRVRHFSFGRRKMQASPLPSRRVLVVGGGPAGSTTAYFLAKAGFEVDVVERSTDEPYGQGIDITDEAVKVVESMGVLDTIKSQTTGEGGFALLDDDGKEIVSLGINSAENGGGADFSPTNEIEITRGALTKILANAAKKEGARFSYGCTVSELQQNDNVVTAALSDNTPKRDYLAVVGADGAASQVRKQIWPDSAQESFFKQTNTYVAYFSMEVPREHQFTYSRFQHADKSRCIWLRPITKNGSRASCYLISTSPDNDQLNHAARHGDEAAQKAALGKWYQGIGGMHDIALRGMEESSDFYFTRVAQVKLPDWHVGRCALVGDAGYCPSPLTGQGTTMALLGAYVLAGELAANPTDPAAAFAEYKRKFDVYVKVEGEIPLDGKAPELFAPQSRQGIQVVRSMMQLLASPVTQKVVSWMPSLPSFGSGNKFQLPEYDFEPRW